MPRAATKRKTEVDVPPLPEALIPPGQAQPSQREAYWIDLLQEGNTEKLKAAIQTTEFFTLLREFPASLWGSRLSIYLYRLEDDDGLMVKNDPTKKNYIARIHSPIDEETIAKHPKCGGGKYQAWLKLDNKETLVKHTFRIDGPPRVATGQTVEIDGKAVPLASPQQVIPPALPAETDTAKVIGVIQQANESAMAIQEHASKTAIEMVKEQVSKSDGGNSMLEKILTVLMERALTPPPAPPDPLAQLKLAKDILQPAAEVQPEPKDPPITEAMSLVESFTGQPFSELIRGKKNPAAQPDAYGWVPPVMQAAQQFIQSLPHILAEARIGRAQEFERQVWLRTAKPGEVPPAHLLQAPQPPRPAPTQQPQPVNQPAPANQTVDPMQVVQAIVNHVCRWFDVRHAMGYQCAAQIDALFGEHIEALGLDKMLTNPEQLSALVQGNPELARRAQDARWMPFQEDFTAYLTDRWGNDDGDPDDEPKEPLKMPPKSADTRPVGA